MARAPAGVDLGAVDEGYVGVVVAELLEVLGLHEEVRLLAEGLPELVHDRREVDELVVAQEPVGAARQRAHDRDILRHDLLHVGALNLDGHQLTRDQAGLVHLRDRRRSERHVVDRVEDVLYGLGVLVAQRLEHGLAVHRLDFGAQLLELVAEALGQNLGPHGEYLAGLHKGRAQLLQQLAQRLRGEPVQDVVLLRDLKDLAKTCRLARARNLIAILDGIPTAEDAYGLRRPLVLWELVGCSAQLVFGVKLWICHE